MTYFGFIYEWTDSTNGKTYIGSHVGDANDGYIGSGIMFKRAYEKRPNKFSREILEYITENNRDVLLKIEQKYLDLIDWSNTYNISQNARGGTYVHTEEIKQKVSQSMRGNTNGSGNKGQKRKPHSEDHKKMIGEKNKISLKGNVPWNKGKTNIYSEESIQKMRESHKGQIPWNKGLKNA